MPGPTEAKLLNARGRVTLHVFSHLNSRRLGMYPIFLCTETGSQRAFGCIRHGTPKRDLERFFGPLDDYLCAHPNPCRRAA